MDSENRPSPNDLISVRDIVGVVPGVIYVLDVQRQKLVFISRDLLGVPGRKEDPDFIRSVVHPDDWPRLVDYFQRLARLRGRETGDFEFRARNDSGEWRWFHTRDRVFSRNEDGSVRETVGIATDATERKIAEERAVFFANLNQALLPLADPDEILNLAVRMLGEYMGVDRCGYAEVEADEDHFTVVGEFVRGDMPRIVGRYRMSEFCEREQRILRENHEYVVNDIVAESPAGADLSLYEIGKIRSMICIPLNKAGSFVARMAVHQSTPRHWTPSEIELVMKVANRCWEALERARVLRRLKTSEDRYRAFIANSSEAIWRYEVARPIPVSMPTDEQIAMLFEHAYLAECNDAMARMYGFDKAEQIVGARLRDLLVTSDPENIARLHAFKEANYRLSDFESREVDRFGNTKYFINNMSAVVENGVLTRGWGMQRDITEHKRAAEALRASEERYRLLTELSPDGVVIVDVAGTIHLANPSMMRLLGAARDQVLGRKLLDFLMPDFVEDCRNCMKDLMLDNKLEIQIEAQLRHQDGHGVPVEVGAVRFDWKGLPFAQLVIHDLSLHKQVEAERRRLAEEVQSERDRLRQILEQMPIGVAIAEAPGGRLLFHNPEAVRILRHPMIPSADYRGYTQYGVLHADGSPYLAEEHPLARSLLFKEVIKGEEVRYRRGDGTETFLSINSAPIYDSEGRMVLLVVNFVDIGERKESERALRESEERFSKAFRASPDSMVISRIADGVILEVNDSFVEASGYTRAELVGHSTIQLGLYAHAEDRKRALAIMKEQNRVRDFEMSLTRKNGEVRLMNFSAEPLDIHGEHCWLILGRDITERKLAEQERERLLEQEKAAREDAEAANRMKDEFLATLSHELRTPLTSILGWSHMLIEGSVPEARQKHALMVIERSAHAQRELIDNILDTSRIITGRLKLDARAVRIEEVFQAAVDVVRPSAEAKRIDLQVVIEDAGDLVLGDGNRLQQVIWNLLSNAVKFTGPDGRVEARLSRVGNDVEIVISDTGMGIEPQFLPYVFDRFRQADSTSTRKYGGLGLGLAIVRHVVEMHGGRAVASSPGMGKGSTFRVTFPIASAARLQQLQSRTQETGTNGRDGSSRGENCERLNGMRLLVVEDDPDTLDLLRFILDKCGATVATAASVDDALTILENWDPDALITDLAMPDRDGYDFIAKVRARERSAKIPAVALTAYARVEDRVRALAAGFQKHISKPVDPAELVAVMARLREASSS